MEITKKEKLLLQKILSDLFRQVRFDGSGKGAYDIGMIRLTTGEQMDLKELGRKLGL